MKEELPKGSPAVDAAETGPGPAPAPDAEASEHTLRAWLTVLGSFLVYFVCFGFMTGFGFFQDYYSKHQLQDYPPSLVAFIGSLQLGLMYLVGPITGVLFDAYGPRRLYLAGATGAIISCVGLSLAQPGRVWQHFLAQGVLFGLTVSFGTQVALAVAGQHFRRNRALAMGVVAGGSSAGGVCFPIMFARLVPRVGFAWSLRLAALLFLVCYGLAIPLSRAALPGRPLTSARDVLDFRGFRDPRYATLAAAMVVGNLGLYVPYNFIEPYLRLHHPDASIASYLLPLINGSSFFGRVAGGLVADRIGGLNLLYPLTILAGLLSLAMWLPSTAVAPIVAFACCYGFCSGIFISVVPSVVARISPEKRIGARLGAFFSLGALGVFTGTPIGGAFVRNGTEAEYRNLAAFAGSTMTGAGLLLAVARALCDRNLRAKW